MSLTVLLAVACNPGSAPVSAPPFLRLAGPEDVPTLDPAVGYDTTSWLFEQALFNTLLDYDDDSQLVGELATGWHVSADGRSYAFELRRDVRFTTGRPLAAADVKYSIERVLDPATRSPGMEFFRVIAGADRCTAGACAVEGIRADGPFRIEFRLSQVDPLFLHKLAMQFAAVVPREEVERWGEDFSRHAVGSGPFMLERWDPGQRLRLVRNPAYHVPGLPRAAGIERLIGVSDELSWFKYEAGEIDVTDIPPAEFPAVQRRERYRPLLRHVTSMTTIYLGLNCEWPPFDDVRVRRAMNHAVDREKILRLINHRGIAARSFLPPNMPGYQAGLAGYPHDPERARALLRAAGHAEGFATTLWVRADEDALRIAQAVQQDLREIGVRLDIRALAWGPFLDLVKTPGQVPFFQLGWQADFPDPSNFLETLLHSKQRGSNNSTFFADPALDALLDRAAHTVDARRRQVLLQRAERRALAAAPWVFLYHPVTYVLVHPRVRNFRLHPMRPPRFEEVWIDGRGTAPPPGS